MRDFFLRQMSSQRKQKKLDSKMKISITFSVLFLSTFQWPLLDGMVMILALFCIGIPHGALDHILYSALESARNKKRDVKVKSDSKNKNHSKWMIPVACFYVNYLMIMIIWASVWYINSTIAFWAFLAISCYHFGEVFSFLFSHTF
jgi:hypothetical protein